MTQQAGKTDMRAIFNRIPVSRYPKNTGKSTLKFGNLHCTAHKCKGDTCTSKGKEGYCSSKLQNFRHVCTCKLGGQELYSMISVSFPQIPYNLGKFTDLKGSFLLCGFKSRLNSYKQKQGYCLRNFFREPKRLPK